MSFKDLLEQIEENQARIAAYGKFDNEVLKKINYKLRLDWNYYSNRMEGGTLTKAETRSVMIGNIDVKGRPLKDVIEMSGHDKIILDVLKMSKGELRIAEKRIKEIHKAIMYEDDPIKATQIGQWKKEPNEIIGYKNEKISFTQPGDVADEIHEILNKTNAELDKFFTGRESLHPVALAAQFHIDYVSIHPFYDGNGRTSRILTNVLLMSCGYPTMVIKDEHKEAYYKFLGDIQAYGGKADLFYAFIAERVIETQQLILDALEGKDIEDLDDVDKEIQLFKNRLAAKQVVGSIKKSNDAVHKLYFDVIKILLDTIEQKHKAFDELFFENEYTRHINNGYPTNYNEKFLDSTISELLNNPTQNLNRYVERGINSIGIFIRHKNFQKDGLNIFSANYSVEVKLDDYQFHVSTRGAESFKFVYDKLPNNEEIKNIVNVFIKAHFDELKKKIGQNGEK